MTPIVSHVTTDDGLKLQVTDWNRQAGGECLPVLCLPGLTRNGRDFEAIARHLATRDDKPRRVIALDSRGRGGSDRDPDPARYTVLRETLDVIGALDQLALSRVHAIGTSRGGLILHLLAQMAGERIGGVVLNDVGPVIEARGLADIASYLKNRVNPASWAEAEAAMQRIFGPTFPACGPEDWQRMARAIYAERNGVIEPDHDPAIVAPLLAMDFSQPLPDLWEAFARLAGHPLMTIRGAHSTLLSEATLDAMAGRCPGMRVLTIAGEGHAPELGGAVAAPAIVGFFASLD